MVRLREIPRTATFAWSPSATEPSIITGTKAGAVDADFSNDTKLELWDLEFGHQITGELQPAASISVDARFHDVAWGLPKDGHKSGIIAGGLESGALDIWDADKLRTDSSHAHISRTTKHTGALKSLQFNSFRSELLATAGSKGELYINDLTSADKTFRLGTAVARADDFDCLDWNKKVAHILVTGSSGGFATVWDARAKKESLTLNNSGRKAVSAIAWDVDNSTKLATATSSDQDPLILMWDLRNSNAPERTLRAHEQGILSLAWNTQDPSLLLSCGKDNRTICWNTRTGEAFGEFPIVTNWTFETRWNPRQPDILATASFDGKIGIQTIQNTNKDAQSKSAAPALDDADFFAQAGTQPQGAAFSLSEAPTWLKRPVNAIFGYGGKLVTIKHDESVPKLSIHTIPLDPVVGDAAAKFEDVLQKKEYAEFCERKIAEAKTEEEKADWTVIETLISGSRTGLRDYLGFKPAQPDTNGEVHEKQVDGDDDSAFFGGDSADDNFLSTLASTKGARTNNPFKIYTGSESDADKQITQALMLGSFEEAVNVCLKEDRISDAFMIAVCGGQKCIDKVQSAYFKKSNNGPNYLRLLASVVGKNLWDVVYNADLANWKEVLATLCTFADEKEFPDLCEALGDRLEESLDGGSDSSVARKDASFCYLAGSKLEKVVTIWSQELSENEKAALQAAEADSEFSIHAKALQDFIEKVTVFREVTKFTDPDASKSEGWKLEPLYAKYAEYADILANNGWKSLASRYLDLIPETYTPAKAAKGRVKKPAAQSPTAAAVQPRGSSLLSAQRGQRVVPSYGATPVPAATSSPYAPAAFGTLAQPAQPVQSSYQPPGAQPGYSPSGQTGYTGAGQKGYAPTGYQPPQTSSYAPSAGYQPSAPTSNPYGASGYQPNTFGGGIAPPPRTTSASPAPPPAATNKNLAAWNDTPDFGDKPRPSRRGTPAMGQPAANPYAQAGIAPPPTSFSPPTAKPVGPPPKAGTSRVTSPPPVSNLQQQESNRPPSAATSAYAPTGLSQSFASPPGVPSIPRGASPYNPPPSTSTGPTSSRYAPAPGTAPSPAPGFSGGPPPGGRHIAPPPAASNYAPNPAGYAPSPYGQPPPQHSIPPPMAKPTPPPPAAPAPPPKGPAPSHAPPPPANARSNHRPSASINQLPPPQRSTSRPGTAKGEKQHSRPRHPAGDRSHIPPNAQPVYQILDAEMQRIKSKAPAQFRPQVLDTEKRLNLLFEALNNSEVADSTVSGLVGVSEQLKARSYEDAQMLLQGAMTAAGGEGSAWMVGVKRLIQMSRATPL